MGERKVIFALVSEVLECHSGLVSGGRDTVPCSAHDPDVRVDRLLEALMEEKQGERER